MISPTRFSRQTRLLLLKFASFWLFLPGEFDCFDSSMFLILLSLDVVDWFGHL